MISAGGICTAPLAGDYQYGHPYAFTPSSEEESVYEVAVYDRATNQAAVAFTVRWDTAPPWSTTSSPEYDNGGTIPVTWTAQDSDTDPSPGSGQASGLAETWLWYRLDGGDWTAMAYTSTVSGGTFRFYPPDGVNGVYDFATVSVDHVGNEEPLPLGGKDTTVATPCFPPSR